MRSPFGISWTLPSNPFGNPASCVSRPWVLRPRLATGLPFRGIALHSVARLAHARARLKPLANTRVPWLCAPASRRVCPFVTHILYRHNTLDLEQFVVVLLRSSTSALQRHLALANEQRHRHQSELTEAPSAAGHADAIEAAIEPWHEHVADRPAVVHQVDSCREPVACRTRLDREPADANARQIGHATPSPCIEALGESRYEQPAHADHDEGFEQFQLLVGVWRIGGHDSQCTQRASARSGSEPEVTLVALVDQLAQAL